MLNVSGLSGSFAANFFFHSLEIAILGAYVTPSPEFSTACHYLPSSCKLIFTQVGR